MLGWLAWVVGCGGGRSPCPELDGRDRSLRERPPNLVLVILDDVGIDKIGRYGVSPAVAPTPTLDWLADEGMLFRNGYAQPTCSASRAAMQTGRQARQTGMGSIVWPWDTTYELPLEEQTLAEMVAEAPVPYCPVMAGKWHLSSVVSPSGAMHPQLQGYRWYEGSLNNLWVDSVHQTGGYDFFHFEKVGLDGEIRIRDKYATTDTTDDAIALLKRLPEPFLLVVAYNAAHNPWHVPPTDLQRFGASGLSLVTEHLAMIEAMDTEMGRLVDEIPSDTLLVVMGDNGTAGAVVTPPTDTYRSKGSVFEGGTRVPLIVRGPGVPAGTETDALFSVVDLFPTFAEVAGVDLEEHPGAGPVDGVSQFAVFHDPSARARAELYTEDLDPTGLGPWTTDQRGLRDERWKILQLTDGHYGLFDLRGRPFDEGPNLLLSPLAPEAESAFLRLQRDLGLRVEALVPPP